MCSHWQEHISGRTLDHLMVNADLFESLQSFRAELVVIADHIKSEHSDYIHEERNKWWLL